MSPNATNMAFTVAGRKRAGDRHMSWPGAVRRPYMCEFNMECFVQIPDLHIPAILIHPYLIRCFLPSPLPFARRKCDSSLKSDSNSRERCLAIQEFKIINENKL